MTQACVMAILPVPFPTEHSMGCFDRRSAALFAILAGLVLAAGCGDETSPGGDDQGDTGLGVGDTTGTDTGGLTCTDGNCECKVTADCAKKEDGDLCNGTLYCEAKTNTCKIKPASIVTCGTTLDNVCAKNTCVAATGKCAMLPSKDGTSCDDGNPCTTVDGCKAGKCEGSSNTCDCETIKDCAKHEDGNICNGALFCDIKTNKCEVNQASIVKCPASTKACVVNACAPETGKCAEEPAKDGAACDEDGSKCTTDTCKGGSCKPGPYEGCTCAKQADCDGHAVANSCKGTLYCNKAKSVCEPNPGTVVKCSALKDTPCIKNTCDAKTGACSLKKLPAGAPCDDGLSCSSGEKCDKGECKPAKDGCQCKVSADCKKFEDGNPCTGTLYCNKLQGGCQVNPATIPTCKGDAPQCMKWSCDPKAPGYCVPAADLDQDGYACEADGSWCTSVDFCSAGKCDLAKSKCPCKQDKDCADKVGPGLCGGDLYCNLSTGGCEVNKATVKPCKDNGKTCEPAQCDPKDGKCKATPAPEGTACNDDGFPCTTDACKSGKCVTEKNACLCWADSDCAPFEDGDKCNGTLYCDKSAGPPNCKINPATIKTCKTNAAGACTGQKCNPKSGACETGAINETKGCDDASKCTTNDACKGGKCVGLALSVTVCDDKNVCTSDSCNPLKGCVNLADKATCTDNNACTIGDACKVGLGGKAACVPGVAPNCNDNNPCTDDACDAKTGKCKSVANAKGCNDGDACTGPDACKNGKCLAGPAKKCNDNNICTKDSCDKSAGGCQHAPLAGACDDGNKCTAGDICAAGACKPGQAKVCDDGNLCTDDSCDAQTGACAAKFNTAPCDDGNKCTEPDKCAAGKCASKTKACDDGDTCTTDSCDPKTGCKNVQKDPKCGFSTGLPYQHLFNCNDTKGNKFFKFENGPGAGWKIDGKPAPGYGDKGCSLNFHDANGKVCAKGRTNAYGRVTTGWFDASKLAPGTKLEATWQRKYGSYLINGAFDVSASLDGVSWKRLMVTGTSSGSWRYSRLDLRAFSGKTFRLRFHYAVYACPTTQGGGSSSGGFGGDGTSGGGTSGGMPGGSGGTSGLGIFIDDLSVNTVATCKADKDCDDKKLCTVDKCADGVCIAKSAPCNDKNPCTTDSCDAKTDKCVFTPRLTGYCSDGNACTSSDSCSKGKCVGKPCNDNNPCTADSCIPGAGGGCVHIAGNDGGACDDGDTCTMSDACKAGACVGKAGPCVTTKRWKFDCGSSAWTFKTTPKAGSLGFGIDASPSPPAFLSGKCSLNFNDGLLIRCPSGPVVKPESSATSAEFSLPAGVKSNMRVHTRGGYLSMSTVHQAWIEISADGFKTTESLLVHASSKWKPINWDISKYAGKKIRVRFRFKAHVCPRPGDTLGNEFMQPSQWYGWFLDDLTVVSGQAIACKTNKDCDDGNACTDNACVGGKCSTLNNNKACDDGNVCTLNDRCANGSCSVHSTKYCQSPSPCHIAACHPVKGCTGVARAENTPCYDSANRCQKNAKCTKALKCVGEPKCVASVDGCQTYSCLPSAGKCIPVFAKDGKACSDGRPCTNKDSCLQGKCVGQPGSCLPTTDTIACKDKGNWTADPAAPEPFTGWHVDSSPNPPGLRSKSCSLNFNDGVDTHCPFGFTASKGTATSKTWDLKGVKEAVFSLWSWQDFSSQQSGRYKASIAFSKDGFKTVAWTWNLAGGHTLHNKWRRVEFILPQSLVGGPLSYRLNFEASPCHQDMPRGWFVDDITLLTDRKRPCKTAKDCDDGNKCTDDTCANNACLFTDNKSPCDDGNGCTPNDRCTDGACKGSGYCSDNNPCTFDGCDYDKKKCRFSPRSTSTYCSQSTDKCRQSFGKCDGKGKCAPPLKCDDGNGCTIDLCDAKTGGCSKKPATKGLACDDGDPCTGPDQCDGAGICTLKSQPCTRNNSLKFDTMRPAIKFTPTSLDVGFNHDATASPPAFRTAPTSLNINNGLGQYKCAPGQTRIRATTETGELDLTKAKEAYFTVWSWMEVPTSSYSNRRYFEVSADNWKTVAYSFQFPNVYAAYRKWIKARLNLKSVLGKKVRFRFRLDSVNCFLSGSYRGWFLDDWVLTTDVGKSCKDAKKDCDDGNPCTRDECKTTCRHSKLNLTPCDDGNVCTTTSTCKAGECIGAGALNCNKGGICKAYSCDPVKGCQVKAAAVGSSCKDGDKCTQTYGRCDASGVCESKPRCAPSTSVCRVIACNQQTGQCQSTGGLTNGKACADNGPCVAGTCNNGFCSAKPSPCSAGKAVSMECGGENDWVFSKSAGPGHPTWRFVKLGTSPAPVEGKCALTFQNSSGNYICPTGATKTSGTATLKQPIDLTGLKHAALTFMSAKHTDGYWQNDKRWLELSLDGFKSIVYRWDLGLYAVGTKKWTKRTLDLTSWAGKKVYVRFVFDSRNCTYNNYGGWWIDALQVVLGKAQQCTGDSQCKALHGCVTGKCINNACTMVNNTAPCDDGNKCTNGDTCSGGVCKAGAYCNDKNACTLDQCKSTGCTFTPRSDGSYCNDGDPCTFSGYNCKTGKCAAPSKCDDKNPCTIDSCAKGICSYTPLKEGASCDDGNPCSSGDKCLSGQCKALGDICTYSDKMISDTSCGAKGWTLKNLTKRPEKWGFDSTPALPKPKTGTCTLNFNNGTHYHNPAGSAADEAIAPMITVPAKGRAQLVFWSFHGFDTSTYDRRYVDVSTVSSFHYTKTKTFTVDNSAFHLKWSEQVFNLADWAGQTVYVRFRVSASGSSGNFGPGWFIDDLRLRVGTPSKCSKSADCKTTQACTSGVCDAKSGVCSLTPKAGCKVIRKLPYSTDFGCDHPDNSDWIGQTGAGPSWQIDGLPASGAFFSASCSLNYNNNSGSALKCASGQTKHDRWVKGPWFDATQLKKPKFKLAYKVYGARYKSWIHVEASTDDKTWTAVAKYAYYTNWRTQFGKLDAYAGKVFRLRFRYEQPDCSYSYYRGGYIDDLSIYEGACTSDGQCDDKDPCTADKCIQGACSWSYTSKTPCDDGNICTTGEYCISGICKYGKAKNCNDNNGCTTDACSPVTGKCLSVNRYDGYYCSDGLSCTSPDRCTKGTCIGTNTCNDLNPCTADVCDAKLKKCVFAPVKDGTGCDDNSKCTPATQCKAGKCPLVTKSCDDGKPCTFDFCDPATAQCSHTADPTCCSKDSDCTIEGGCYIGSCAKPAGKSTGSCSVKKDSDPKCCFPLIDNRFHNADGLVIKNNHAHVGWHLWKPATYNTSPIGALWMGSPITKKFDYVDGAGKPVSGKWPVADVQIGTIKMPANNGQVKVKMKVWWDAETSSYRDRLQVFLRPKGTTSTYTLFYKPPGLKLKQWFSAEKTWGNSFWKNREMEVWIRFDARSTYKNSTFGVVIDDFQVWPTKCPNGGAPPGS